MKKLIYGIVAVVMVVFVLVGCGENTTYVVQNEKLSVVTTIFPEYDWVKELTKGNDQVEITMLLDKGIDLHSFQPTTDDIMKISKCDMFIYVGGESDGWVRDALAEAVNKNMIVINLLDVLGDSVKEEEVKEGMEAEEEEDEGEEEEGPEYDEHVWLSLKNAKILCQEIATRLGELDDKNRELYQKNADTYINELSNLDQEYQDAVQSSTLKTVLFGDRFPFRYLVDDYGMDYYAAFVGCSAESEASFETITFLAQKVDELQLPAILQIESADGKIAQTIKDNTEAKDQEILTMNSMQATTSNDVKNGVSYDKVMKENLEVLKKALSK